MEKITGLMSLLGEENEQKIKDSVTEFIIEAVKDDLGDYNRTSYILRPEEIIEFVHECSVEAFERLREETVNSMVEKIKKNIGQTDVKER